MSMMLCEHCQDLIDSDYHPEYFRDDVEGEPFVCEGCYERLYPEYYGTRDKKLLRSLQEINEGIDSEMKALDKSPFPRRNA